MKTKLSICRKKTRFASAHEAEAAAEAAPFKLRAYRCELCRKYHLTSRTKGMKTPHAELARRRGTS